ILDHVHIVFDLHKFWQTCRLGGGIRYCRSAPLAAPAGAARAGRRSLTTPRGSGHLHGHRAKAVGWSERRLSLLPQSIGAGHHEYEEETQTRKSAASQTDWTRLCISHSSQLLGGSISHGVGCHFKPSGSFLKEELVMNGIVKYLGSSTIVVTVNHSEPSGS